MFASLKALLGVTKVSLLPAQAVDRAHSTLGWREGHPSHVTLLEGPPAVALERSPLQTAKFSSCSKVCVPRTRFKPAAGLIPFPRTTDRYTDEEDLHLPVGSPSLHLWG